MTEFTTTPATPDSGRRERALSMLAFGAAASDHMVTIGFDAGLGWHAARLGPYAPFSITPMSRALHYGQSIFEGMKAFRQADGSISVFRAEQHARRFARSAERMAMPPLPTDLLLEAIEHLLAVDGDWVPPGRGESLYLRPFMFASEEALGFRPANEYTFCLFGTPAGAYYGPSTTALKVWIEREYVRAAPGGTGAAKCVGNYGGSLLPHQKAVAAGCDQVLWLDGVTRTHVEELGGMNVFFVHQEGGQVRVSTPPLSGTILDGVTRRSLLELAHDLGFAVEEEPIAIADAVRDAASGSLVEMFACGTAVGVVPIGEMHDGASVTVIGTGKAGPTASTLGSTLLDIQHGADASHPEWRHPIGQGSTG
jgi:branched-chain amino acid aminotransferase